MNSPPSGTKASPIAATTTSKAAIRARPQFKARETQENTLMTNAKPHPKTPGQVLAQQKLDAERDQKRKRPFVPLGATHIDGGHIDPLASQPQSAAMDQFAKPSSQPPQSIVPAAKQAVAVPDNRTDVQRYVDEIAPSSIAGRLIKFSKNGEFVFADTDETGSADQDFVALCDEVLCGWIRFHREEEGVPPDRVMGLLYDQFVPPPRESLGDLNPADWPIGLSGAPEDCWQHQILLPLQTPGTHELFTYATTSKTGRRACGALLRHFDRMRKKDADRYPVVRLKSSGFNHRDPRIGFVPTPLLAVVGTAPKASASVPDTSPAADFNNEIPFK
jgi:hypothetical protein